MHPDRSCGKTPHNSPQQSAPGSPEQPVFSPDFARLFLTGPDVPAIVPPLRISGTGSLFTARRDDAHLQRSYGGVLWPLETLD